MPARTAYFGLLEVPIAAGETVLVSGAAGAVGSIVIQLAKIFGCTTIAIASSAEKAAWLKELGADHVINYPQYDTAEKLTHQLQSIAPQGIDIYWDNVGGYISDSVWPVLNLRGRVIICGQITQYNGHLDSPELGPRFLHHVLYKRLTIKGILARDYNSRMGELIPLMTKWLLDKKMFYRETVLEGFEKLPSALNALFHSTNIGKMIVKV
jgi:NADPH-dependent curcumin reductase CurA